MSLRTYPLGTVTYVHQNQNIQLRVSGSAQLSSSCQPSLYGDETNLFEAVKVGKVWVSRQPSLLFQLSVKVHGLLHTHKTTEPIFNDMSEILGTAKLWSDLHLIVASRTSDVLSRRVDIGQLNIALQIQEDSTQLCGNKPSNLSSSVWSYFNSTCRISQPPAGIPVAAIRRIDISLDFAPTVPSPRTIGNPSAPKGSSRLDDDDFIYDKVSPWSREVDPFRDTGGIFLPGDDLDHNFQLSTFHGAAELMSDDETWESLDNDSPFSSQQSGSSRSSAYTTPERIDIGIDRFAAISLLDTGFRDLFSSKRPQTRHGHKPHVETEKTGLVDIAPNVFSPTYRTAISQRAWLIPKITQGLMSLISSSRSPEVKAKVQALETIFSKTHNSFPDSQEPPHASSSPADTREIIKCLLWKTMQRGLLQTRKTAPKLSPLNTDVPCTGDAHTLFAAMDECWDDPAFDGDDNNDDVGDGVVDFVPDDFEDDILMGEDDDDDDDDGDDLSNDAVAGTPIMVAGSAGSIIDDFSDAASESSLMFEHVGVSPPPPSVPPPMSDSVESAERDVRTAWHLLDSAMHSDLEMLDCSSSAGEDADLSGKDGDDDMLLF